MLGIVGSRVGVVFENFVPSPSGGIAHLHRDVSRGIRVPERVPEQWRSTPESPIGENQGSRHARAVSAGSHAAAAYNAASKTIIPNAPAAVIGCVPPTPPEATSRPTREEAKFASVSGSRPASAWTATSMDAANATGESRDAAANAARRPEIRQRHEKRRGEDLERADGDADVARGSRGYGDEESERD